MPLKKGTSRKTISKNVAELMRTFNKKHKIGNIKPKSKMKARKIASAIAYRKAGKGY